MYVYVCLSYPDEPPAYLANYSFNSLYFHTLLSQGYQISDTQSLVFADSINGTYVEHSLGLF